MNKSDVVRKFIDENPDITANRRIAIIVYEQNPGLFDSIESARGTVRNVVGANGHEKRDRIKVADKLKYFRSTLPDIAAKPEIDNSPYNLDHEERMVIWNDLHGPWFDKDAIERALELSDADTLYLNGDIADFYWVSRYYKDPKMQIRFAHELEKIREFLFWIRDKFDTVYYKLANHEDRLPHYLANNAPALATLPELETHSLLKLDELGIKVVGTHRHAQFDELDIIHGHEVRVMGGVNLALSYLKAWQGYKSKMDVKLLVAHHHRFNYGTINNPDGTKAHGWVNGCLCQKAVGYAPKNNWQHGITIVTKTSKGVQVEPIPLYPK